MSAPTVIRREFAVKHNNYQRLVILTGAGISAESGIQTFRAADGLWEEHRIEEVATPEGFRRNPNLVHQFYNQRRQHLKNVRPNAAHMALARLEKEWEGSFLLITQNVDDLHERAGNKRLLHMHGSLLSIYCQSCEARCHWQEDLSLTDLCPACAAKGQLRPDIVWFGEEPYHMKVIESQLEECELFISIGTSGAVYPAAGFAQAAWHAHRIEINLQATEISSRFHEHRLGSATHAVPQLVTELLSATSNAT
jgi:NAD-dependent deacetylase